MSFKKRFTSARIIILGFAGVILLGALLLMLPISSQKHVVTPFLDCLFTSTSAVCVTGLIVHDTATYWTSFGQFIILLLIQIGGMGVVTIACALAILSGRKIGILQRATMQDSIGAFQMGGIMRMVKFIIKGVLLLEGLGAVSMAFVFIPKFGLGKGIWYAIFHSISAFCNAGFDLMGVIKPYSSIMTMRSNPIINWTIMLLIIIGGLGFFVWNNILVHKWHFKKYSLHAKVVLTTTVLLLVIPSVYFFFGEFQNAHDFQTRFFLSAFQSVTARTAGFNSVDFNTMTQTGAMVMTLLMLIGGSPGSTAGGMKTTTFAVMLANVTAIFHRDNVHMFHRRIDNDTVRSAATIFTMYITLCVGVAMIISRIEGIPMMACLFEAASAIGTVGCTMGITPHLCAVSHILLILLMYFGRVGGLTLAYAVASKSRFVKSMPEERISVG
ncbi:MAG: Trk family potassium uptake protein [Absicoccus porci]|uniref:TrkH family potassium uptake protein n=1 Tax=Absicoccus porci TaxID=2486576 RepID=UPI002355C426|nr:potassium transporter TrkG [Absicoccus porci]MCI6087889.1 Trk family potassium uptake protein [Absicoccus porci]